MVKTVSTDIMLYMSAQNDLSQYAEENIGAIENCANLDDMCVYIMLDTFVNGDVDDASTRKTVQYLLPPGASTKQFKPEDLPIDNRQVHSSEVFSRFLDLAELHFDDRETRQKILVLWGHGGGMFMLDEARKKGSERARASIAEFSDAILRKADEKFPLEFDIVAFDSCYMCMIEAMHELRNATKFALCSSTLVSADGYPYEKIIRELKAQGKILVPKTAALLLSSIYNDHYRQIFPDGNRILFVCDMQKIESCIEKLNALGEGLSSLMDIAGNEEIRSLLVQALIAAGVESSYVYVLRFLKALSVMLDGNLNRPVLNEIKILSDNLALSVRSAFVGDMGDTTDRPISPLIWAPFLLNTFELYEADYNALSSSQKGTGGWVSMWRKFHHLETVRDANPLGGGRIKIGLPIIKSLS